MHIITVFKHFIPKVQISSNKLLMTTKTIYCNDPRIDHSPKLEQKPIRQNTKKDLQMIECCIIERLEMLFFACTEAPLKPKSVRIWL